MHAPYREGSNIGQALVVRPVGRRTAPVVAASLTAGISVVMGVFAGPVAALGTLTTLMLVHRLIWNPGADAADEMALLPFPVLHDRNDAMAFGSAHHVLAVIVRVHEYDTAVISALPDGVNARICGTELTLTGKLRSRTQLANLLTTWGIAVHERVGIVGVEVAWSRTSGPPMSL